MKQSIIILFIIIILAVNINERHNIIIPKDAIRFRIIANSNNIDDQKLKVSIKNDVEKELYEVIKDAKSIEEARNIVKSNLSKVDNILKKYNINYEISFGNNYFPNKEYKGIKYKAGEYESLVIKIDKGLGNNWWCVLFPPLCLLDEQKELNDIKYEFYASKLINKFK